jgi:hypothetical protein
MHSQLMFNECIARTEGLRACYVSLALSTTDLSVCPSRARETTQCPAPSPSTCIYQLKRGCSTYFPASDSEEETQHIGLLALLKFFDVLEGTHFCYRWRE